MTTKQDVKKYNDRAKHLHRTMKPMSPKVARTIVAKNAHGEYQNYVSIFAQVRVVAIGGVSCAVVRDQQGNEVILCRGLVADLAHVLDIKMEPVVVPAKPKKVA